MQWERIILSHDCLQTVIPGAHKAFQFFSFPFYSFFLFFVVCQSHSLRTEQKQYIIINGSPLNTSNWRRVLICAKTRASAWTHIRLREIVKSTIICLLYNQLCRYKHQNPLQFYTCVCVFCFLNLRKNEPLHSRPTYRRFLQSWLSSPSESQLPAQHQITSIIIIIIVVIAIPTRFGSKLLLLLKISLEPNSVVNNSLTDMS